MADEKEFEIYREMLGKQLDGMNKRIEELKEKIDNLYFDLHNSFIEKKFDELWIRKWGKTVWQIVLIILGSSSVTTLIFTWFTHHW